MNKEPVITGESRPDAAVARYYGLDLMASGLGVLGLIP
jgi:hypothetical protein